MELSQLMHSLTLLSLRLSLGEANEVQVRGDIAKLTPELTQALSQHKQALAPLLCCIPPADAEREAVQFADTPQGQARLPQAIDAWQSYTKANHLAFVKQCVKKAKSIAELELFESRFQTDCEAYETYRPIRVAAQELIRVKRYWLGQQLPYNEASGQSNAIAEPALTNPFLEQRN
jgi:hypothetical protein